MSKYGVLLTTYNDGSLGAPSNLLSRPEVETGSGAEEQYYVEEGPNYALWGLIGVGVLVVGGGAYMMMKK